MRNIPAFTTEFGVASLILEQIPFNRTAYIQIQASANIEAFLRECADFCKAVGAEKVFASGDSIPAAYGQGERVVRMRQHRRGIPRGDASLTMATVDDLQDFYEIFNRGMYDIPGASCLTLDETKRLLLDGACYFVHRNRELIGIGVAKSGWIHAIVSLKKGMGEAIIQALCSVLSSDAICVELIESNIPAKKLYDRMGFEIFEGVKHWYKIF